MISVLSGLEGMSALTTVKKYNAVVRLRISQEMKSEVKRLAGRRKVRPSDLYRQAINEYLRDAITAQTPERGADTNPAQRKRHAPAVSSLKQG